MVRGVIRACFVVGALGLAAPRARAEEPPDARDKTRSDRIEKKDEAVRAERKSDDDKNDEAAGEHHQKRSKASGKRAEETSD